MKRLFCAILALSVAVAAFGVDKESFDQVVDFETSLQALAEEAQRAPEALMQNESVLVLDGVVSGVNVIDEDPETFRAEINLVSGRWRGLDQIVMYKVVVIVQGPEFAARIPMRPTREEPPGGTIERNKRVIVAGTIAGVADDPETERTVPVLNGYYVRNM
ncbi:MAG: hypothetical protein ACLFO1_07780 [Spirochaetaceae bacterium]